LGCGYEPLLNQNFINVNAISFEESVPFLVRTELENLEINASSNKNLILKNYQIKERKIYGGSSIRALQGELKGEMMISISNPSGIINKKLTVMRNFSISELNPLAENETIKSLEESIQKELVQQIIFEVRLIEM
jgi:hypothetical protein